MVPYKPLRNKVDGSLDPIMGGKNPAMNGLESWNSSHPFSGKPAEAMRVCSAGQSCRTFSMKGLKTRGREPIHERPRGIKCEFEGFSLRFFSKIFEFSPGFIMK